MDGDQSVAFKTTVPFILFNCESFNPDLTYTIQILLYTHTIIFSVPDIHPVDPAAGVLVAGGTKFGSSVPRQIVIDPDDLKRAAKKQHEGKEKDKKKKK